MPFGVDRPLPADFQVTAIARRRPTNPFGPNRPSPGKAKGTVAKITRDLKQGIIDAAVNVGRDGYGTDGLVGFLEDTAINHRKAFCMLLAKILPMQLHADGLTGPYIGTVHVHSVPSGTFLTHDAMEQLQAGTLQLEHVPLEQTAPINREFEPQTERERRLLAELEALSPEQLLERAKQAGFVDVDSV